MTEYIGYTAAILTSLAFAPQAIKTIRTKSTDGISLGTYLILNIGIICWIIYGVTQNDLPIILANSVTFLFSFTILYLKLKHR